MTQASPFPPPGFEDLSADEKLDYVQSLWDHIRADPAVVPIPEWHLRILEERLAEYEANPDPGRPWEEVLQEIFDRDRSRE